MKHTKLIEGHSITIESEGGHSRVYDDTRLLGTTTRLALGVLATRADGEGRSCMSNLSALRFLINQPQT
jgi:hypothetical protein